MTIEAWACPILSAASLALALAGAAGALLPLALAFALLGHLGRTADGHRAPRIAALTSLPLWIAIAVVEVGRWLT